MLVVHLEDINDNDPEFSPETEYNVSIPENAATSTALTTVRASDRDVNRTISFYFLNDTGMHSTQGFFSINNKGVLCVIFVGFKCFVKILILNKICYFRRPLLTNKNAKYSGMFEHLSQCHIGFVLHKHICVLNPFRFWYLFSDTFIKCIWKLKKNYIEHATFVKKNYIEYATFCVDSNDDGFFVGFCIYCLLV